MASTLPRSLARLLFLVAAALVGSTGLAAADSFWLESNISVNLGCEPGVSCLSNDDPVDLEFWGPIPDPGGVAQGSGYVSLNETYGGPGAQLTVSAEANADYGVWQAAVSADYDLTGLTAPGEYRFASASAQSFDELAISVAGLNGQVGSLDLTFVLNGDVSASGSAQAAALLLLSWDSAISPDGGQPYVFFDSQNGTVISQSIPFVFGDPFRLSIWMGVGAGTLAPCAVGDPCEFGVDPVQRNDAGFGSADFFSTLTLVAMVPRDALGNVVSDPLFSSASGTRYTEQGVVPEPATLLLLGVGGIALGLRRRNRRV